MKLLLITIIAIFSLTNCTYKSATNDTQLTDEYAKIEKNYQTHCASCHGENRSGIMGPALIPETIGRQKLADIEKVITNGREATQMPAYKNILTAEEISSMSKYLQTVNAKIENWTDEQIKSSRTAFVQSPKTKPTFKSDPWNLFFVVSHGDHGLSILDGDKFEILKTLNMRPGLHGGIKYSKNGKLAYAATRDGWLSVIDVYGLQVLAEVRVAINTRNIAISEDGKYVIAANQLPSTLVLLDAKNLNLVKTIKTESKPSAVYTAFGRKSFVVGYKDSTKLDEYSYDLTSLKEVKTLRPFDDFMFDPSYRYAIGTSRGTTKAQVVDLNQKEITKEFDLEGMPHVGSGIAFKSNKNMVLALPNMKLGQVSFVDTKEWKVLKTIPTSGAGFFLRTHENTDYIFSDSLMSPAKDEMHIISKKQQAIIKTLKPEPGKTFAHTEFTKDGKYVLISIWEEDGALLVYDVKNLKEFKRIPMKKPSGKYNIYNKTHLSLGTSH